jgi:hypothetical protein
MQTYGPAGGGATFGQLLLRWGFLIFGLVALWFGIDKIFDWSSELSREIDGDLGTWLLALGLLVLAGILFGIAFWLPVPARGGRPSAALGLGIPLLLINGFYAAIFHIDFSELPDFLQSRVLVHPLLSLAAASTVAILLGIAIVSGFCPAGYAPLARLGGPRGYVDEYAFPGPMSPPPQGPSPPPQPRTDEPTSTMDRPDNQQTRRLPPEGP